ncbi:MAG: chitobiase/beta-hexosaminidase C-terminal domain-containing protein, partial [Planctomycetota bacterium]
MATPTFNPAGGTYSTAQSVTLSCATTGATIYYTLDGTTPSASSTKYTGAINVAATTTIKAYAVNAGMTNSAVASAAYTISGGGNAGPLTITSLSASPNPALAGFPVVFTATASDSAKPTVALTWDFGDGTPTAGGTTATHIYNNAADATFTVNVTATDGPNNASATLNITVHTPSSGGAGQPSPNVGYGATNPVGGASVTIGADNGGVVVLQAGQNGNPLPAGYSASTTFYDANGKPVGPAVQGTEAAWQFTNPGMYLAVVTVTGPQGTSTTEIA